MLMLIGAAGGIYAFYTGNMLAGVICLIGCMLYSAMDR